MATHTLGTSSSTVLVAVQWNSVAIAQADVAAINSNILDDQNPSHPVASLNGSGGFVKEGTLYIPNRGILTLFPGDWVAYDPTTGFAYLVPATAVTGGDWIIDD